MQHLTMENFEAEAKRQNLAVMVMFYATWCGKCAMMKSLIIDMERVYRGRITFYEVDIEESKELALEYETDIVPTFVLFRDGEVVGYMQGIIGERVFEQRLRRLL